MSSGRRIRMQGSSGSRGRRAPVKIGIDVGGTFTHAVALHAEDLSIIGTSVVPTTHAAAEGVARGVVQALTALLDKNSIRPGDVHLVAHSTTQATNALLEGDVAPVGIIGMAKPADAWRARSQTRTGDIGLAPGKFLRTVHTFLESRDEPDRDTVLRAAQGLREAGATVFVVSEAFSVDDPVREVTVADILRAEGYLVTAASDISKLYGLKVRTRTAVINASMLPTMLETADMTERSVREAGIRTPLMIMRSDGGIMDIGEMRRRPILTMLSGPAAGVAAALMFVRISDGLFLEVGGTSTDISIIRNGRPMVRTAQVGGHRLFLKTLDIRTVGIGGGSMVRYKNGRLIDVGPRSAHIAGLGYPSFSSYKNLHGVRAITLRPRAGDPDDYVSLSDQKGKTPALALTTTDAANLLGVPMMHARARTRSIALLKEWMAGTFGGDPEGLCRAVLGRAATKIMEVVDQFVAEYKLERELLVLVGGGGGAEAIVPEVGARSGLPSSIAAHAPVISAIGVALGMIRDTVERSVIDPGEADIVKIRKEVMDSVLRMGASADSLEVRVEVDTKQKRLVATAMGVPELRKRDLRHELLDEAAVEERAVASFGLGTQDVREAGRTSFLRVFSGSRIREHLFGLISRSRHPVRVIGADGIIRLKLLDGLIVPASVAEIGRQLPTLVENHTRYGDAGGLLPDIRVAVANRIIDLSGVATRDQMLSLFRVETEEYPSSEPAVLILSQSE